MMGKIYGHTVVHILILSSRFNKAKFLPRVYEYRQNVIVLSDATASVCWRGSHLVQAAVRRARRRPRVCSRAAACASGSTCGWALGFSPWTAGTELLWRIRSTCSSTRWEQWLWGYPTGWILNHRTVLLSLGTWPTQANIKTVAHLDFIFWFGGATVTHVNVSWCSLHDDWIYISASSIHVLAEIYYNQILIKLKDE